jgi:hypothetical protein
MFLQDFFYNYQKTTFKGNEGKLKLIFGSEIWVETTALEYKLLSSNPKLAQLNSVVSWLLLSMFSANRYRSGHP